jgi:preprotein translocase subunit YajC
MKAKLISEKMLESFHKKKKVEIVDNVFLHFLIILFFIIVILFLVFRYIDKQKKKEKE